jgi:hypothetical protein
MRNDAETKEYLLSSIHVVRPIRSIRDQAFCFSLRSLRLCGTIMLSNDKEGVNIRMFAA